MDTGYVELTEAEEVAAQLRAIQAKVDRLNAEKAAKAAKQFDLKRWVVDNGLTISNACDGKLPPPSPIFTAKNFDTRVDSTKDHQELHVVGLSSLISMPYGIEHSFFMSKFDPDENADVAPIWTLAGIKMFAVVQRHDDGPDAWWPQSYFNHNDAANDAPNQLWVAYPTSDDPDTCLSPQTDTLEAHREAVRAAQVHKHLFPVRLVVRATNDKASKHIVDFVARVVNSWKEGGDDGAMYGIEVVHV